MNPQKFKRGKNCGQPESNRRLIGLVVMTTRSLHNDTYWPLYYGHIYALLLKWDYMDLLEQKWEEQKVVASRNRTGVSSDLLWWSRDHSTTIRTDHYTMATYVHCFLNETIWIYLNRNEKNKRLWPAGIEPASHRTCCDDHEITPQRYVLTTILWPPWWLCGTS